MDIGGFSGAVFYDVDPFISNCSWWTGSFDVAIGNNNSDGSVSTLSDVTYGTDEPDNTLFYSKTHAVYAQE
jgi:hypothetical protein